MTIANKTILQQMRFVRAGAPFCPVTTRTNIDAKNFDFVYEGGSFYGESQEITPPIYTYAAAPVRLGAPFNLKTTRTNIDASGFDYVYEGGPFWVKYIAPAPGGYNTTQFFMVF